jgi:DUF1009 family protein
LDIARTLGIIAGNGVYPILLAKNARRAGVSRLAVAAFENETRPEMAELADDIEWMRVGQLGRMLGFFRKLEIRHAVMAGQIAPKNLFDLRPDMKALLILGTLKARNAETIFGAIADELAKSGVTLLPATTFMEDHLAPPGLICGPRVGRREMADIEYGFRIAKEVSRLNIGQTVVVKSGTVLAVEALEGTNNAILRAGELGRKEAVMVKVSKPGQDLRFDVPVVGMQTLETAHEARLRVIAVEAGQSLILEAEPVAELAAKHRISLFGVRQES